MKKTFGTILIAIGTLFCFITVVDLIVLLNYGLSSVLVLLLSFYALLGIPCLIFGLYLRNSETAVFLSLFPKKKSHSSIPTPKKETRKECALRDLRAEEDKKFKREIEENFRHFLAGEGKLPEGYSEPYNQRLNDGFIIRYTPFTAFFEQKIKQHGVDRCHNNSKISDWLYFDGTPNTAAVADIVSWVKRHKKESTHIAEKCHTADCRHVWVLLPEYCKENVMIVVDHAEEFDKIAPAVLGECRENGISFCKITSDKSLFDLIEQKEKEIEYVTYPNYHDEIYADWSFQDISRS